jgi:hypothetical protein
MPQQNEPISISKQFENAMNRLKIYKDQVSPTQWQEMERAFYAGASAILVLMQGPIPDLPQRQAEDAFSKLIQEAEFYWKNAMLSGFKMN